MSAIARRLRQPAGTRTGGQYAPDTRGATSIPTPAPDALQAPSRPPEDPFLASMRAAEPGTPLHAAYRAYLEKKDELAGPATCTWFGGGGFPLTPQATTARTLVTAQWGTGRLAETAERVLRDTFGSQVLHGFELINELTGTSVCTRHGDSYGDSSSWSMTARRGDGGTYSFYQETGLSVQIQDYHVAYYMFHHPEIVKDIYTAEERNDIGAFFHAWVAPNMVPRMFNK